MKGLLIVFEGADRAGKSTQCHFLCRRLEELSNKKTDFMAFPDRRTAIGSKLDSYLKGQTSMNDHSVHLLFTANRWERAEDIKSAISQGRHVIVDRYSYSGIAYTMAKQKPKTDGPDFQWCLAMEQGLPWPDLVFCLRPARIKHLESREGFGEERFETTDFQCKVMQQYEEIAKLFPDQWKWIDFSSHSVEEVHNMIMDHVEHLL